MPPIKLINQATDPHLPDAPAVKRERKRRPRLPDVQPLAVKPLEACQMLGCGITKLYEKLGAGELESYLDGRSRLITTRSIEAYVARKLAAA